MITSLNAILLLIAVASAALCTASKNKVAKNNLNTQSDSLYFSLLTNIFCALVMFLYARTFRIHTVTFLLAIVFGGASMMSGLMNMVAFRYGPMSLTSLISSGCSLIISTILGTVLFHESVTPIQIVGVVLVLVVITLLTKQGDDKNIQKKWLPSVALAALFGGSLGIIQKLQGATAYAGEKPVFLLYTFLFCTIFNEIWLFVNKNTGKKDPVTFPLKAVLLAAVIGGVTCAVTNIINLKLAIEIPSVIFFPAYSGSLIMVNALVSALWFKEKLSLRQKAAFAIGFIALFMLADIF